MATATDPTIIVKVHEGNQGDALVVESGGEIGVLSGGTLEIKSGATFKQGAQTLGAIVAGVAAGYKVARGVLTNATAVDTVVTGLTTVIAAVASLESDLSVATIFVQAEVGDQAGTPAAGSILVKSWKPTAVNDVTPTAATSFGKLISWIAIGT